MKVFHQHGTKLVEQEPDTDLDDATNRLQEERIERDEVNVAVEEVEPREQSE